MSWRQNIFAGFCVELSWREYGNRIFCSETMFSDEIAMQYYIDPNRVKSKTTCQMSIDELSSTKWMDAFNCARRIDAFNSGFYGNRFLLGNFKIHKSEGRPTIGIRKMKRIKNDSSHAKDSVFTPAKFLSQNPMFKRANGDFIARKFRLEFERLTSIHPECKRRAQLPAMQSTTLIRLNSPIRKRKRRKSCPVYIRNSLVHLS